MHKVYCFVCEMGYKEPHNPTTNIPNALTIIRGSKKLSWVHTLLRWALANPVAARWVI